MRSLGIVALCAVLSGCGAPAGGGSYGINQAGMLVTIPPKPNWDISRKVDRLTDKPVTTILNTSKTAKITNKPGFAASILGLSCGSDGPSASFYFGFPVGSNRIAVASYRFDSLPAQNPKIDFLNMEMFSINGADARVFFQQLAGSTNLFIQVSSVTGQATAEFDTSGSEAPLAELATCLQAAVAAPSQPKLAKRKPGT
jgi:hypothetical protein